MDRSQPCLRAAHMLKEQRTDFQEYALNRGRETAEKVLCSPSKVPLIIDQSQPTLRCL